MRRAGVSFVKLDAVWIGEELRNGLLNSLVRLSSPVRVFAQDNDRLKEDLALETRQAKHATNVSASAQIAKLQDQVRARVGRWLRRV